MNDTVMPEGYYRNDRLEDDRIEIYRPDGTPLAVLHPVVQHEVANVATLDFMHQNASGEDKSRYARELASIFEKYTSPRR